MIRECPRATRSSSSPRPCPGPRAPWVLPCLGPPHPSWAHPEVPSAVTAFSCGGCSKLTWDSPVDLGCGWSVAHAAGETPSGPLPCAGHGHLAGSGQEAGAEFGGGEVQGADVQGACVPGHSHRLWEVACDQAAQRHRGGAFTAGFQGEDGRLLDGDCRMGSRSGWPQATTRPRWGPAPAGARCQACVGPVLTL